jgi:hypothetical protein
MTKSLDSGTIALAFALHTIKLNETANERDFGKFMLNEIFPSVDTRELDFPGAELNPDQHFLLGGRGFDEFVWMMRLEYFIHHTPLPTWLDRRAREGFASVKDKIEQFGTRTSTELLYDVKEWHQRLGID